VLKDDMIFAKVEKQFDEQFHSQAVSKGFILTYLVKTPKTSKAYQVWEIICFFVLLCEFALVPYTICTHPKEVLEVTYLFEFVIDCLWILNMCVSFTTAFVKDVEIITDLREIAMKYLKEGFFIDFITTFPTLCTFYTYPEIYYIKILRLYYISRSQRIIKVQISSLESRLNISKQTIYKIDYFMSILVIVFVMMHSVSCVWLLIGEQY